MSVQPISGSRKYRSRRRGARALLALCAAVSLASLSACGGESASPTAPAGQGNSDSDVPASILSQAPVAAAADMPAGSPMAEIKQRGYLTVGAATNNVAFGLLDPTTNKVHGFDVDMAAMLAKYIIGTPNVKRVLETSATREPLLNNHSVDVVIATYTVTPERAKNVTFAGPYFMSGGSVLVKKSDNAIKKVSDLNGKTVCAETNATNALTVKQAAPGANVILFNSHAECLQALREGRAEAFANDEGSLLGDVAKQGDVKVAFPAYTQAPYGIGVAKGQVQFAKFIDKWITTIEQNGLWAKAYQHTLGDKISGPVPTPPKIGSVPGTV